MSTLKEIIKNKIGSFHTDFLIGSVLLFAILAVTLSIFPVYTQKNLVDGVADDVARYVELMGHAEDSAIADLKTSLADSYGLDPDVLTVTVDAPKYFGETNRKKIQIMDPFTVSVTYETEIGISYYARIPITLKGGATGRSEQYWK